MAWCRQATSHYLNQCWSRSRMPYGVTRLQCVKTGFDEPPSEFMVIRVLSYFCWNHECHDAAHQIPQLWNTFLIWGSISTNRCNSYRQFIVQQERLKYRNTLGCLDQYAAQNSKYARPPIPAQPPTQKVFFHMIRTWNIHTVKQSMTRSCSNGCSLNWFTPYEFFQFSQLTN